MVRACKGFAGETGINYVTPMTTRPILIHPDPRLKKVAEPVGEITDKIRVLAEDMLETMYAAPGIGLAAPQVGVGARILVMDCVKEEGATTSRLALSAPPTFSSSPSQCLCQ